MVLYRVDKRLRMFDPHAHCERFGFQAHAPPVQQLVNIPGRMSRSKNHSRSFIKGISDPHPFYAIVVQFDIGNPRIENERSAGFENRPPDIGDHPRQFIRSDMGMGFVKNFGRSAVKNQRLQRFVVVSPLLAAGEKFAVGECSGSALAEGIVRIGIDRTVAVDLRDVPLAGRHIASPLQNHRAISPFDQPQSRKQPRRARTDDHDLRTPRNRRIVEMHGCGLRFAIGINFERKIHFGLPLPGVDRTSDDPHQSHILLRDTRTASCLFSIVFYVGSLLRSKNQCQFIRHNRLK